MTRSKRKPEPPERTDSSLDELDAFLNEFGPGFRVKLYRLHPQTRKPAFVASFDLAEVSEDMIRDTYGGGTFQLRAYEHGGDGVQYRGSRSVDIDAPPRDLSTKAEAETSSTKVERLELERQELADRLRDMSLEQRFDTFRRDMLGILAELKNPPPQANQRNPMELAMEIVREMSALRPHVETPAAQVPQLLDIFRQGFELGREGAGDGGEPGAGYLRVVDRILPAISGLLSRPEQPTRDNPPEEGVQEAPPVDLRSALAHYVPRLVTLAQQGKDPDLWANVVLEELPTVWVEELDTFLETQGGSAITTVLGWYPQLNPHRVWMSRFIEALRPDEDQEEQGDQEERPGTPGVILGTIGVDAPPDSD